MHQLPGTAGLCHVAGGGDQRRRRPRHGRAGGRGAPGAGERDGAAGGGRARPRVAAGEQCGRGGTGVVPGHHRRPVAPLFRRERGRSVPYHTGGAAPYAPRARRVHRQRVLHLGPAGRQLRGDVLCHQGRADRADPFPGVGAGAHGHPGQLRCAGCH